MSSATPIPSRPAALSRNRRRCGGSSRSSSSSRSIWALVAGGCFSRLRPLDVRERPRHRRCASSSRASLLLVCVLLSTAVLIYVERKIWGVGAYAARPERGRPVGHAAAFRRLRQVHPQGADHPGERQQGRVRPGAAGVGRPRLRRLGGRSRSPTAGWSPTSTSASSTCSRCRRSASTASSWRAGRRIRSTRCSPRCARRRRWCPTRCRSASSSSPCSCARAR